MKQAILVISLVCGKRIKKLRKIQKSNNNEINFAGIVSLILNFKYKYFLF